MYIQAVPIKIVIEMLFQQCTFLKLNLSRLVSRSQTSVLDDKNLDDTRAMRF